jgi:hypothetical protein
VADSEADIYDIFVEAQRQEHAADFLIRPRKTARRPSGTKIGRTSKTVRGARRQTIVVSALESLRQHLATFTLSDLTREFLNWSRAGQSCFARLPAKMRLSTSQAPLLDRLLTLPST